MDYRIESFAYDEEIQFEHARKIRTEVFVLEQGVSHELEYDGKDKDARHYLVFRDDLAVATARWRQTDKGIKLECFAVLPAYRNQGIGKIILDKVLSDVKPLNRKIYLHSQDKAVNFYLRNGFSVVGDEFFEAGIRHFLMNYE
ncbi:MAG: GNAT family N-acetyltransferase [Bacteroidia bacterium]|nr:GNAT family N-acetyltransferase [Bacteroidia bacterium]